MSRVDFHGAGKRHYADAELLMQHKRIPNAGQLFGFAAECGLKALLVAYGLQTDPNSGEIIEIKPKRYKTHINILINNVTAFSSDSGYATYLSMIPGISSFARWKTDHRYCGDTEIPPHCNEWHASAKEVMLMLDQAKLDGVIA